MEPGDFIAPGSGLNLDSESNSARSGGEKQGGGSYREVSRFSRRYQVRPPI